MRKRSGGGALALAVLLTVGACGGPADEVAPAATPSDVPAPTEVVADEPTLVPATPEPAATPGEPVATPTPLATPTSAATATPIPTATPAPTATAAPTPTPPRATVVPMPTATMTPVDPFATVELSPGHCENDRISVSYPPTFLTQVGPVDDRVVSCTSFWAAAEVGQGALIEVDGTSAVPTFPEISNEVGHYLGVDLDPDIDPDLGPRTVDTLLANQLQNWFGPGATLETVGDAVVVTDGSDATGASVRVEATAVDALTGEEHAQAIWIVQPTSGEPLVVWAVERGAVPLDRLLAAGDQIAQTIEFR